MKKRLLITLLLFSMLAQAQNTPPVVSLKQHDQFMNELLNTSHTKPLEIKQITYSRSQIAKSKVIKEEQKLIKLAAKRWEIEDQLKISHEKLENLDQNEANPNFHYFKNKCNKIQKKLTLARSKVDQSTQRLKALEEIAEDLKFTRQEE